MRPSKSRRSFRSFRSFAPVLSLSALIASAATGGSLVGCGHSWDDYDPRLASSSSSSGDPTGGMGGNGTSVSSSSSSNSSSSSSSSSSGLGGMGGMGGMAASSSSSSSSGMAGMGGGGGGKCGGTSAITSNFPGNNEITGAWSPNTWGGATITEKGGELVVTHPMVMMSGFGASISSDYSYDIREDFVSIEVTRVANTNVPAWTWFNIGLDGNNYIEIFTESTDIIFGQELNGNYTKFKTIPYDAVAHRFWKIRESGGMASFETSPDGQTWTTQIQISTNLLFPMDLVRIEMGSGTDGVQSDAGEAHFANFNGGGIPVQKVCPMNSYTDNFDDGMRNREWGKPWEDMSGMLAEESGHFAVHLIDNTSAGAGLRTSRGFDLSESDLVIEMPMVPTSSSTSEYGLDLDGPGDRDIEMFYHEGKIDFGYEINDNYQSLGTLPYSPQDHRWWRIRGTANSVAWETSPDGKTWKTQLKVSPPPVAIDLLSIEIYGAAWQPVMMPGEGQADNVNLPPP